MHGRHALWLSAILLLGLGLRLAPLLNNWDHPGLFMVDDDSWGYQQIAVNLLEGNGYSQSTHPPYEPDVYRPAGLPCLLAAVYYWAGPSVPVAILLQVLVSAGLVLLTYRLALALGAGPRLALGGALVLAIDPLSIVQSNLLLSEVYSSLVVLAAACLVAGYFRTLRLSYLPMAGALLGLGILVHPILLFAPFLLMLAPLFSQQTKTLRHGAVALLAGLVALLPALAWTARNRALADYTGISCVAPINMLKYKAAGVIAELRGTSREAERDRLTAESAALLPPGATRGEKYRLWQAKGAAILLEHPFVYARIHARGMLFQLVAPSRDNTTRLIDGARILNERGRVTEAGFKAGPGMEPSPVRDGLRYLALAVQGVLGLCMLVGVVGLLAKGKFKLLALLLLPAAYVLLLSGGPESEPRFRVIYMPFLCLLAAVGVAWGRSLTCRGRKGRLGNLPHAAVPVVAYSGRAPKARAVRVSS